MTTADAPHPLPVWDLREVPCPACAAPSARFVGLRGGTAHVRGSGEASRIVRCRSCGLLYPRPMPFPRDLSHYSDPDTYFVEHGEPKAASRTSRDHPDGPGLRSVCTDARHWLWTRGVLGGGKRLGWEARGVEPSAEFAIEGGRELGVAIDVGTVESRYAEASFGLVLLSGVLDTYTSPVSCSPKPGESWCPVDCSTSMCRTNARYCIGLRDWHSGRPAELDALAVTHLRSLPRGRMVP